MKALLLSALLLMVPLSVRAVQPDEMLPDAGLEARARAISRELRCLVCQNESIDDSNAPLARDLRLLVRQRLVAGDSDAAATAYIQQRYGDYVLLRPPVKGATLLLWYGPLALLVALLGMVWWSLRRGRRRGAPAPLTPDEEARLALIEKADGK